MTVPAARRPLRVRSSSWAQSASRALAAAGLSPNQISVASVFFAGLAAICLWGLSQAPEQQVWLLAGAVLGIQLRLLCNLFDGMVAVEGGRKTPAGELFNDMPDRIADPLILVCAGYGVGWEVLGWAAGLGAVLTAYVRMLAAASGAPMDFRGPMAKQHRMALLTLACLLAMVEPLWGWSGQCLQTALAVIALGCVITVLRRLVRAYRFLEARGDV